MAIIKLSAAERVRLSIFFTCIILAFAAWLFYSLSLKYKYSVKTLIAYKNLPINKAFYPLQSDTVMLTVEGTGWQLLFSRFNSSIDEIKVDLSPLEKRNFVSFNGQLGVINQQFSESQKVLSVDPDTLFFDFATRKVKRIPVMLLSNINFKKQFGQSSAIELKPSYVTVTGPLEVLKRIDHWDTDTFRRENVERAISSKVFLKGPKEGNVSIFPKAVDVYIPVEEITEKVLTLPVKVINNPHYYNVKAIPNTVKVVVKVALSDYEKVDESNIQAHVDLSLWEKSGLNKLPIEIKIDQPFVKLLEATPQQVDFMIGK